MSIIVIILIMKMEETLLSDKEGFFKITTNKTTNTKRIKNVMMLKITVLVRVLSMASN